MDDWRSFIDKRARTMGRQRNPALRSDVPMTLGRLRFTYGTSRHGACLAALVLLGGPACAPEDVDDDGVVETAHLRITSSEDNPICAGTPLLLERELVRIADTLELPLWSEDDKLDTRFGIDSVAEICAPIFEGVDESQGCVRRASGDLVLAAVEVAYTAPHELVHAVRRHSLPQGPNLFEEGLAEVLSGSDGFPVYVRYPHGESAHGPVGAALLATRHGPGDDRQARPYASPKQLLPHAERGSGFQPVRDVLASHRLRSWDRVTFVHCRPKSPSRRLRCGSWRHDVRQATTDSCGSAIERGAARPHRRRFSSVGFAPLSVCRHPRPVVAVSPKDPHPGPVELLDLPLAELIYYYPSAQSFVSWLWETYDRPTLMSFMNNPAFSDADAALPLFETHFGLPLADAEQAWRNDPRPDPIWGNPCIPERTYSLADGPIELSGNFDCREPTVYGASYFMSLWPMCLDVPETTRVRLSLDANHGQLQVLWREPCDPGPASAEAGRDKRVDPGETIEADIVGCRFQMLLSSQEPGFSSTPYTIRIEELEG